MPRPRVGLIAPPATSGALFWLLGDGHCCPGFHSQGPAQIGLPWLQPISLADLLPSDPTKGETGLIWHLWAPLPQISDPRGQSYLWSASLPSLPTTSDVSLCLVTPVRGLTQSPDLGVPTEGMQGPQEARQGPVGAMLMAGQSRSHSTQAEPLVTMP